MWNRRFNQTIRSACHRESHFIFLSAIKLKGKSLNQRSVLLGQRCDSRRRLRYNFHIDLTSFCPAITLSYLFVKYCYHNWVTYLFSNCTSKHFNRLDVSCCLSVSIEISEWKTNISQNFLKVSLDFLLRIILQEGLEKFVVIREDHQKPEPFTLFTFSRLCWSVQIYISHHGDVVR